MRVAIWDIDGTIAHHPQVWTTWEALEHSTPIEGTLTVLRATASIYYPIFVTWRPEVIYDITRAWLNKYVELNNNFDVLMNDYRAETAPELKYLHLKELIEKGNEVAFAIDDDPQVCTMYRSCGVPVIQVAPEVPLPPSLPPYGKKD